MSDKYTLIAAEYAANMAAPAADAPTLTKMCLWIGVSKSGYYEWKDRPLSATAERQEYLKGKIEEIFDDNDETYGYRRVHAELARQGEQATSELVRRLMRDLGLVPCQVRKPKSLTTQATDIAKIPDRVRRDFTAAAPYLKLISDITEIRTWQGKVYLATVIDCFSKEVIGWTMASHFRTRSLLARCRWPRRTIPSLRIASRIPTAEATIRLTTMRNCSASSASASRSGERNLLRQRGGGVVLRDPQERARVPHSLPDREKAMRDIARYIELRYNRKRLHSANGYRPRRRSATSLALQVAA